MGVGNGVGMGVGQKTATEPTPHHSPNPTPEETAKNQGFEGEKARVYDGVGKNAPFDNWCAVEVSDEEIPPEFLKPTPPPQEKQAEQVQLSL